MEANLTNAIKTVSDFIKINSVESAPLPGMPFGEGNAEVLSKALDLLKNFGFTVKNLDNYCGYGEVGSGEMFAILGHLDVVPAGDGWIHDPFGGTVEDGKIFGRGAMDDKGPMIAAIFACAKLLQEGLTPKKRIRFILGCDEESGWECMNHYAKTEEIPDIGFSPDADFPVINCEKGIVYHTVSFPTPDGIYSLSAGNRANMVPDKASATLAYDKTIFDFAVNKGYKTELNDNVMTLTVFGKSAHGSTPDKGKNALIALFEALGQAYFCFRSLYNAFSSTDGSGIGLDLSDEESGSLTLNLGTAKIDGGSIVLELDIRYPVSYNMDIILDVLKASLPLFDIDRGFYHLPLYVRKDSFLVKKLLEAYNKVTHSDAEPISIGGGTYARFMKQGVAFGPQFPGTEPTIHQKEEYIDINELNSMINIYYEAIKSLCF